MDSVIDDNRALTKDAKDLVVRLCQHASVLPVQGPPGSGKTFTGARMILELVSGGHRVGITAVSHKVISNLLYAVCDVARQSAVELRAVLKSEEIR